MSDATITFGTALRSPYDVAASMVTFFRDPGNFTYDTDLRDAQCEGVSTVECFATIRRGFCQWYATTMAVFLRQLGIPSRYVEGFLPGDRVNGVESILYSSAHAWVEVYFPNYGWVEFDPTGGGIAPLYCAGTEAHASATAAIAIVAADDCGG